ncbi:Uncharacterised protein [Legionella spiritensis]|nr:Uncharacterised protein [Legionella spiritensis]
MIHEDMKDRNTLGSVNIMFHVIAVFVSRET